MILVFVGQTGDVQLARAFVQAVGDRHPLFLLFQRQGLLERFGPVRCKHGLDPLFCMLNASNFDLAVSFSGPTDQRRMDNLLLLSCFNELGIPTAEIQHGLFQYGINNVDVGLKVGTQPGRGDQVGIRVGYAARHVLPWGGAEGIGYIKSVLPPRPRFDITSGPYVLWTTNNNWHVYTDEHRYRLAIALVKLAMGHPDIRFVWKPHPAETVDPDSRHVFDMLRAYALPNVSVISDAPAEDLIPGCEAAITTVSTTLVDLQLQRKPVLLYDAPPVEHLTPRVRARTFRGSEELLESFAALRASPEDFLIDTGVGPLDVDALNARLETMRATVQHHADPLPIVLRYVTYSRSLGPDQVTALQKDFERTSDRLAQIKDRVGILHRSTIAYKTKRLVKRVFGGDAD